MSVGVDFSNYEIPVDDQQSMIDLPNPDHFARYRLTDEVQVAVPMQGSFWCEFLDNRSLGVLPFRRMRVIKSGAWPIALGWGSAVKRAVRFHFVIDSPEIGELITQSVMFLRYPSPAEMAGHCSVETLDLSLCLGMTNPGVDRPDSLLDQQDRGPTETV